MQHVPSTSEVCSPSVLEQQICTSPSIDKKNRFLYRDLEQDLIKTVSRCTLRPQNVIPLIGMEIKLKPEGQEKRSCIGCGTPQPSTKQTCRSHVLLPKNIFINALTDTVATLMHNTARPGTSGEQSKRQWLSTRWGEWGRRHIGSSFNTFAIQRQCKPCEEIQKGYTAVERLTLALRLWDLPWNNPTLDEAWHKHLGRFVGWKILNMLKIEQAHSITEAKDALAMWIDRTLDASHQRVSIKRANTFEHHAHASLQTIEHHAYASLQAMVRDATANATQSMIAWWALKIDPEVFRSTLRKVIHTQASIEKIQDQKRPEFWAEAHMVVAWIKSLDETLAEQAIQSIKA